MDEIRAQRTDARQRAVLALRQALKVASPGITKERRALSNARTLWPRSARLDNRRARSPSIGCSTGWKRASAPITNSWLRFAVMTFRREICKLWHNSVQIEREVIFGPHDAKYRPLHLADDANTMFAGFVGRRYRTGAGILLLAINPGGGGDAYRSRTGEDEHFYPLLRAFKRATPEHALEAFERVNETFAEIVRRWNVWKIIEPTLEAAGKALDEAAYMNLVPYRTRANKMPPVAARRTAVKRFVEPTIDLLVPRAIVALGKKAGKIQDTSRPDVPIYCVRRTRGDTCVHADAAQILAEIRRALT